MSHIQNGPHNNDEREATLTAVILSLPKLLARCDGNVAATIVADLVKAFVPQPILITEKQDELQVVLRRLDEIEQEEIERERQRGEQL